MTGEKWLFSHHHDSSSLFHSPARHMTQALRYNLTVIQWDRATSDYHSNPKSRPGSMNLEQRPPFRSALILLTMFTSLYNTHSRSSSHHNHLPCFFTQKFNGFFAETNLSLCVWNLSVVEMAMAFTSSSAIHGSLSASSSYEQPKGTLLLVPSKVLIFILECDNLKHFSIWVRIFFTFFWIFGFNKKLSWHLGWNCLLFLFHISAGFD